MSYNSKYTGAEIEGLLDKVVLATDTEDGLMSAADKATFDKLVAANNSSNIASLDVTKAVHYCALNANATLGVDGTMYNGQCITAICLANAARTVAIPSGWVNMDTDAISVAANKYVEISILFINSKYVVSYKVQ